MLFLVLSLMVATPVFANEKEIQEYDKELEKLAETGEIVYTDNDITVWNFGNNEEISDAIFNHPESVINESNSQISPFSSVVGPGGRSSIVAADSGRAVYWSVSPATAWPYHFSGVVELRYHSGFKRDAVVGGMGALGSTVSGAVTMNKNNGGVAYLKGTAYALNGSKHTVLPGVHTSFRPN